jgi:hypothetical protein
MFTDKLYGTLAGYYVTYAVGLLRRRLRVAAGTADAQLQSPRSSR